MMMTEEKNMKKKIVSSHMLSGGMSSAHRVNKISTKLFVKHEKTFTSACHNKTTTIIDMCLALLMTLPNNITMANKRRT